MGEENIQSASTEPVDFLSEDEKKAGNEDGGEKQSEKEGKSESVPGKLSKSFARLTQQRYERDQQIQSLEEKNAALEAKLADFEEKLPNQSTPVIKREDFDSEEEYLDARVAASVEMSLEAQREKEAQAAKQKKDEEEQAKQEQAEHEYFEKINSAFVSHAKEVAEKIPDFEKSIGAEDFKVSPELGYALRISAKGPEISYYLSKNPEKLAEIHKLPVDQMMLRIGEMGASIDQSLREVYLNDGPEPGRHLSGGGGGTNEDLSSLSNDDWFKKREEQLKGKRGYGNG